MDEIDRKTRETYRAQLALGHEVEVRDGARFVRRLRSPSVYDANFVQVFEASTPECAAELLCEIDTWLDGFSHRQVFADSETPDAFLALLALENFRASPTLQLVLEGDLLGSRAERDEIHAVQSDADWKSMAALKRIRDIEDCKRLGQPAWNESVTQEMIESVRAKAPDVQFFIARDDDRDVAYFSSYPGTNGVGMVEDLFTLPEHRSRGIARSLIQHCVADARERGASAILIGADPTDTPKDAYVAMGFRPTCVTWAWLKTLDEN